ncbi:MAG: HAMP domain-containing histidine kinase [Butyrivibrio sp.]|nr:HAMP domain-containing histidine kinase [Butyrivibrio sp.]
MKTEHEAVVRRFHIRQFKWMLIQGIVIVFGSVASLGSIIAYSHTLDDRHDILMLALIPPMTLIMIASSFLTSRSLVRKMGKLLDAIDAVAAGNMDVSIDTHKADEYTAIYENFNRMVKELKLGKENMQNFSNEFTHEFKTPITSIKGFARYLIRTGEGIEDPERMKYLGVIEQEAGRLAELAQKTLLLSKLDACQIVPDRETYDLSEQLRHCIILLMPQIDDRKIKTEIDLPMMKFCGNKELIEQIWINLLNNAVKFTPEKGIIAISGMAYADRIEVRISDNGMGMDAETIRHIFDRYYQSTSGSSVTGNGIGLFIVHRIAELSGGSIEASGEPGSGSTFTVRLPV